MNMKTLIEKIIQLRNPKFVFDSEIDTWLIIHLITDKLSYLFRGLRVLLKGRIPKFLLLGSRVRFFNFRNIRLGKWVKIENDVYLSALGRGKLSIGDNSGIGAFSRVIISTSFNKLGAHITIGNNVGIGEFAYLGGAGGLSIGDDCIIGQYFSCHPENHHFKDKSTLVRYQNTSRSGIYIGKNCWIGAKVTILDGVEVGDGCVIAAGAVVTKSMPPHSLVGGVPAKILKRYSHISRIQEYTFNDEVSTKLTA
jgi:acetyltransferase-like isoleucine patch superfamily enzyme